MLEKSQLSNSTPVAVFLFRVILSDFLFFFPPFRSLDTFVNLGGKKNSPEKSSRSCLVTFLLLCGLAWLIVKRTEENQTVNYPALGNNNGSDGNLLIFALTFLFSRQQKIEGEARVCLLITEFWILGMGIVCFLRIRLEGVILLQKSQEPRLVLNGCGFGKASLA